MQEVSSSVLDTVICRMLYHLQIRISKTNSMFPMLNEESERKCKVVKEIFGNIRKQADRSIKVEEMRWFILSDICFEYHDRLLPDIRTCYHDGRQR